jgi:predicted dehydrogenase
VTKVSIIGTGFVADLYMRSLETFPEIEILKVFDSNPTRLAAFCTYWNVVAAESVENLLAEQNHDDTPVLILNLTNPASHFDVSRQCLVANKNVYSEKPLALRMDQALELHRLASSRGLVLASAPCSYLSEVAQTTWLAVRRKLIGKPLLIYAELDDDFITQAPFKKWISESGAPWPYEDEFNVGCTLEHAGYYLTWLMMIFGSVTKVTAASAELIKGKIEGKLSSAPDYSTAVLFFESGTVARITCSILAPHNHQFRIFGETGVIEVNESWNNDAKVKIRKRYVVRRRLVNSPIARTFKIKGKTHPKVTRRGAASMNFALGVAEVLSAITEDFRKSYLNDFALHLNEVTLAIHNSLDSCSSYVVETKCPISIPMAWAK